MLSTTETRRERIMVTTRREKLETGPAKAASTIISPSDKTATIAGCPKTKACRFCTVRHQNHSSRCRWITSLVKCSNSKCTRITKVCSIHRPSSNLCLSNLNNLFHNNNFVNIKIIESTPLSVHDVVNRWVLSKL